MNLLGAKTALVIAGLGGAAALGVAFTSEWYAGLVPCALCLVERWPYRGLIALTVVGVLLPSRWARCVLALQLLVALGAVVAAGTHVGVERKLWPSPLPECTAPRITADDILERLKQMPEKPSKPCDDPVYPVEAIPASFAEADLTYALALSAFLAISLAATRRSLR
jgi:disulfide bond formation protein DsbB